MRRATSWAKNATVPTSPSPPRMRMSECRMWGSEGAKRRVVAREPGPSHRTHVRSPGRSKVAECMRTPATQLRTLAATNILAPRACRWRLSGAFAWGCGWRTHLGFGPNAANPGDAVVPSIRSLLGDATDVGDDSTTTSFVAPLRHRGLQRSASFVSARQQHFIRRESPGEAPPALV